MSQLLARLVYDGGDTVYIPPELGTPRGDQMQGTPAEQLCELSGRACYDSLGKGRPSFSLDNTEGYHDHIKAVGHGSVWEHFNFTVEIKFPHRESARRALLGMVNRPGSFARAGEGDAIRISTNLRGVVEWERISQELCIYSSATTYFAIRKVGAELAPHIVSPRSYGEIEYAARVTNDVSFGQVEPEHDEERWATLFLSGSRGFSHELVRHKFRTAVSQRSTRYVDECESPWIEHPLITLWKRERDQPPEFNETPCKDEARRQYLSCVQTLEQWLIERGVSKATARKQARGAARGYLGNALATEMLFSASVGQWRRMLRQRATIHADAEIRQVFCQALAELKRSRHGARFDDFTLEPSPYGIGLIAVEQF